MNTAQLGKLLITSAPLGKILLAAGKITRPQLDRALEIQRESKHLLGEILIEQALTTPEDIAWSLGLQLNIPVFKLGDEFRLEPVEVAFIPVAVARRYGLFAMKKSGADNLTLVMSDPLYSDALATVRSLTQLDVHRSVGT